MANEQNRQPTSWGTTRPGPLEGDDLVTGAPGSEGRSETLGGIRRDEQLDPARGTPDEDLAATTLGIEENDDLDVGLDEYTDLDFDDNDLLDDEDVVSEGGALDHDQTENVYETGDTGAGGTFDDDETMGPNQRQPDAMALDRSRITNADLRPQKGSEREDVGTSYNTMHARTTAGSESERLPGEDQLDSFREHEPVIGSYTGADIGTSQSAAMDEEETDDGKR